MPVARFLLGSSPISVLYGFPSYDIVEPEDEDVGETFAILLLMAFSQADQVIGPSTSLQHALEDHGANEKVGMRGEVEERKVQFLGQVGKGKDLKVVQI